MCVGGEQQTVRPEYTIQICLESLEGKSRGLQSPGT